MLRAFRLSNMHIFGAICPALCCAVTSPPPNFPILSGIYLNRCLYIIILYNIIEYASVTHVISEDNYVRRFFVHSQISTEWESKFRTAYIVVPPHPQGTRPVLT